MQRAFAAKFRGPSSANKLRPFVFGQHFDAELLGVGEFRAGARPGTCNYVISLRRHRTRRPWRRDAPPNTFASSRVICSSAPVNTTVFPATAESLARSLGVADAHLRHKVFDAVEVLRLTEVFAQTFDNRVSDLVECIHLPLGFLVVLGELQARGMKGIPGAVAPRQRCSRSVADSRDPKCVNESFQRNLAPGFDGREQIADRSLAEPLDVFEADFVVAPFECENIGRFSDPFLFVEKLDLLLAEPVDVESAAGNKVLRCSTV